MAAKYAAAHFFLLWANLWCFAHLPHTLIDSKLRKNNIVGSRPKPQPFPGGNKLLSFK